MQIGVRVEARLEEEATVLKNSEDCVNQLRR